MVAEQVPIGLTMIAIGFLWYSHELSVRGSLLWGQAFQIFAFLFIIADLTVMQEFLVAEGMFDLQSLVFTGLFGIVYWVMWIILGLWIFDMAIKMVSSLGKPNKIERADSLGNSYGPR